MKKECTVKITDIQYDDGEKESIEITTKGTFEGEAGNYKLSFDEIFDTDMRSHTVVSVKNGDCVTIVRQGDITTELTVERGKRHNCHYLTPYGEMMLGISANQIEDGITENGGVLKLVYLIDYYTNVAALKEMLLEVTD